jgi:hypothetical protein
MQLMELARSLQQSDYPHLGIGGKNFGADTCDGVNKKALPAREGL